MRIDDLTTFPGGLVFEADLCIVGSGPAGLTLAQEMADTGLDILILESGGLVRQNRSDALDEIESVGEPRVRDQWDLRNRMLGGSSNTWSGKCTPFDDIDYEARPWVPYSGWPIGRADMDPFLERSARYLGIGLGSGYNGEGFWEKTGLPRPRNGTNPDLLRPFFWQISQDSRTRLDHMRFGRQATKFEKPNVRALVNATVTHVNTDPSGSRACSVEVANYAGGRCTVRARTFVLSAGGIENPRLLLASNRTVPEGVGNRHDRVGRFLMDHRRGEIGTFDPETSSDIRNMFASYRYKGAHGTHTFLPGLALSPDLQEAEGLLNCAVWVNEVSAPDDPWDAIKRIARRKGNLRQNLGQIAASPGLFGHAVRRGLARRGLPHKASRVELQCMIEQTPNPDSRLTLGDRLDPLGMPIARIDWRISEQEQRTVRRAAQLVMQEFGRLGWTLPRLEPWAEMDSPAPIDLPHIAHPTGATRMSADPRLGVVDADCQVHGVEGLFVCGSSVFPTGGHANPTQLIVAMAIRLADHLKSGNGRVGMPVAGTHGAVTQEAVTPMVETQGVVTPEPVLMSGQPAQAKARVLVTGATGRIGRHLVQELLARGYAVRALTSKSSLAGEAREDGDRGGDSGSADLEWRHHDFLQSLDFDSHVAGCDGVLHLGAEIEDVAKMHRVNVEATRALARSAEKAGIRFFGYTSSIAVYGTSRTRRVNEASPVVTAGQAVRGESWTEERARAYGRTKLGGELAIREEARNVECVIFRPTSVVDVSDVAKSLAWSPMRKFMLGHRRTHHVYVLDVVNALVWFLERSLERSEPVAAISLFNLGEEDAVSGTYADFFNKAWKATGDKRFACPVRAPWVVDWARQVARYRSWPLRVPRGITVFETDRLFSTGYRHRHGMAKVHGMAIESAAPRPGPATGAVALEH